MLNPATVIMLLAFGAIGAVIGWRRGTKALRRRSLREPDLAPGETRREHDRRLRRRRKVGRLIGTLLLCLVGIGIGLLFVAATTMRG